MIETDQTSPWPSKRWRLATGAFLAIAYICIFAFSSTFGTLSVGVIVCTLWLAAVLISLSVVDIETYSLPDALVAALAVGGLIAVTLLQTGALFQNVLAAIITGLLVLAMNWIYLQVRGRHGIGFGDAKLLAAGTIWLGGAGIVNSLLWACLTGLAHCIAETVFGSRLSRTIKIPFGPHIALGIWMVWLFGPIQ